MAASSGPSPSHCGSVAAAASTCRWAAADAYQLLTGKQIRDCNKFFAIMATFRGNFFCSKENRFHFIIHGGGNQQRHDLMLYALKKLVGNDVEKDLEKFGNENSRN